MLLWLLVVIVLTLVVLHFILNNSERARLLRKVPGPDYRFVVGNALQLFDTQVRLIGLTRKCTSQWPGIYRLWAFSIGVVNIYNVEDIELALSTKKFNEKSIIYDFLRPWLQDGLLISDGQKWHERRKILTPAFHFNILRRFFAVIQENSTKLVNSLTVSGEKLDIVPVISDFTLTALCETAMGTQFSDKMAEKGQAYKYAIYDLSKVLVERATRVILHPDFIFSFTSLYRRQCNSINTIKHFTQNVIKERQEYLELSGYETLEENEKDTNGQEFDMIPKRRRPAMLDLLLLAKKDGLIDDQGIQEEVDTLCASEWQGHDTTASGLTYCLMVLASHKEIQDKIYAELFEIFGDSNRSASYDDLNQMKYLECCIKESLRLYPPVPIIGRKLTETVTLSGYTIPENTFCHVHIYEMHRCKDTYPNPLKFDPDRFLPENSVGRHPFAYIPFSAGPRNCIGQRFAMMEMKIVLSSVLRHFELEPVTMPFDLMTKADLVLKNHGPIYVTFNVRKM